MLRTPRQSLNIFGLIALALWFLAMWAIADVLTYQPPVIAIW